jgi:nucleoside triphosphate pyrophosphatase
MGLWLAKEPLVLASASKVRRGIVLAAGIPLEAIPADIDERRMVERSGLTDAGRIAALLAREKALAIAARLPDRLVLGADQTLALDSRVFSKPQDITGARAQLEVLRGKTHALHAAIAVMRGASVLFEHHAIARLTMRHFSDVFLDTYLAAAGTAVTASVGAYQLEKLGIHLFEEIAGDHFTILGLPLLPFLDFLRRSGFLAA